MEPVRDPGSGLVLVLPESGAGRQAPPAARQTGDAGQPTEAASFHRSFTSPDGSAIELGGIAWSETGPFALINGRVLGLGDRIEGFVIERIHPRQVELRGATGTVFLTLN